MKLQELGLIRVEGGLVRMGTSTPLVCELEGHRANETPVHYVEVKPFWIGRTKVTNLMYEKYKPKHQRPPQAKRDGCPVVDITYGDALRFCDELNKKTGLRLRLPTEEEWCFSFAPMDQEFVNEGKEPDISKGHVFNDGKETGVVPVDDPRWSSNFLGLDQMGHNVSEYMMGHRTLTTGSHGYSSDGTYCIVRGGDYGHCKWGLSVNRRGIVDIASRNPRIGMRLAHDDN
jgi:formylglycine-generating enzyme required for sulfatase activity